MSTPIFEQLSREHLLYNEPPTGLLPVIPQQGPGVEDYQFVPAVHPEDALTGPIPTQTRGGRHAHRR